MRNYILFGMMALFLFALTPHRLYAETTGEVLPKNSVHGQSAVAAPQSGGKSTGLVYENNIGFMKDVPRELREALPMCDEFLDVKWIREMPGGYWVGRVVVDVSTGEKKEQRELVVLEKDLTPGRFVIFDVTTSNYRDLKLESLIMSAEIVSEFYAMPGNDVGKRGLAVVKDRKQIVICDGVIGSQSYLENGLIASRLIHANTKVCIAHPDKKKWLIKKK